MKRVIHFLLAGILLPGSLALLGAPLQAASSALTGQSSTAAQSGQSSPAAASTQSSAAGASAASSSPASAATASMQTATQMQAPFDPTKQIVVLPRGSVLHMRLQTTLTSKTNKSGDKFQGMVTQPVVANDKTVIPEGSLVYGHVVMAKASGRVAGTASMRLVLDSINTPDDVNFLLHGTLQDLATSTCTKGITDNEGTIKGCGKSKKKAAEGAAIVGGIGAASGASVGATEDMICTWYGCPGQNPNILKDAGIGAAIGGGTALMYSLLKHEKQVVLVSGSDLTFVVDRTVQQQEPVSTAEAGKS
jgi:hypothetical protein